MAGVTEVLSGLVRPLIGSHLEIDDTFTGSELLVCEVSLVLLRRLGTDEWTLELRVEVALQSKMIP